MATTTDAVTFTLNGQLHTVRDVEPYRTLNDYIRDQPNLKGTKHNCGQVRTFAAYLGVGD